VKFIPKPSNLRIAKKTGALVTALTELLSKPDQCLAFEKGELSRSTIRTAMNRAALEYCKNMGIEIRFDIFVIRAAPDGGCLVYGPDARELAQLKKTE
jgi:hypothetical protein